MLSTNTSSSDHFCFDFDPYSILVEKNYEIVTGMSVLCDMHKMKTIP